MMTLNLGCGNRLIEGAVHHDRTKHRPEIEVVHDLNVRPWPWADKSFDQIVALSVLEHLDIDLVASLNECHRILRPAGQLVLKLPLWNAERSYDDPTHRWVFTLHSLDQLCPETERGQEYTFYTPCKWKYIRRPQANPEGTSMWATLEALA